jgi:hypothetical protein
MLTGGLLAGQGMNGWAVRPAVPILARFLGKFVLDIMPAALASVIGGFLFTQYQFGHTPAQHPAAEAVVPASAEMLALVRDEHAMIVDYLKSQMAAEKSREAAQTRDAEAIAADGAAANADGAAASVAPRVVADASIRHLAAATVVSRPATARAKPAAAALVASVHAPLVIAQAEPLTAPPAAARSADQDDRDTNSLLGKTLDLKDHVVAATRHVVFAIGDVFASMGQRIGDLVPARQLNSAS